jgi:TolB-like protein/DNA-binding winged helix-turn-helix (wHTH) protein/thioredoxin-like negative regulator of GroEL
MKTGEDQQTPCFYEFGPFRVDSVKRLLLREGTPVALTPKAFETLLVFIQTRGQVLGKDELMQRVWPDTVVEENNLAQSISALRKALGEGPHENRYIATVPGRGYRFVAGVTEVGPAESEGSLPEQAAVNPDDVAARTDPSAAPLSHSSKAHRGTAALALAALAVAALVAVAAARWLATRGEASRTDQHSIPPSIAVLPFVNLSPEKEAEYFSDGVTEEITSALARISGLRVASRSSAFQFKGRSPDARQVGQQLGVGTVLEGGVRKVGDQLRITVQLINTADGYHLWSKTYDRNARDIFAIQQNIADSIAHELRVQFAPREGVVMFKPPTENVEAHNLVLKARSLAPIADNWDIILGYFNQALTYDPNYAAAYVGLASTWNRLAVAAAVPPKQVMEKARQAADRALQLDGSLPEAHFVSALVKWNYEWDWAGADREFRVALDLQPSLTDTRMSYALYLAQMGRSTEALAQMERIRVLEPQSPGVKSLEASVYYLTREYDRTIQYCQAVLAGDPWAWPVHYWMGRAYASKGQLREALASLEKWHNTPERRRPRGFGMLAATYARAGRKADALKLLDQVTERLKRAYVSPLSVAQIYIGLGDSERAIQWLEKAYEERDTALATLKIEPAYDPLRSTPAFRDLLRRLKLD